MLDWVLDSTLKAWRLSDRVLLLPIPGYFEINSDFYLLE